MVESLETGLHPTLPRGMCRHDHASEGQLLLWACGSWRAGMSPGPLRLQLVLLFRGQVSSPRPGNQILAGFVVSFSSSHHFVKLQTVAAYLCRLTGASCDICFMCCRARKGSTMIAAYWLLGFEELKALPGVWRQKGDSSVLLQGDLKHKYGYEHSFKKQRHGEAPRLAPTSGWALAPAVCIKSLNAHRQGE